MSDMEVDTEGLSSIGTILGLVGIWVVGNWGQYVAMMPSQFPEWLVIAIAVVMVINAIILVIGSILIAVGVCIGLLGLLFMLFQEIHERV